MRALPGKPIYNSQIHSTSYFLAKPSRQFRRLVEKCLRFHNLLQHVVHLAFLFFKPVERIKWCCIGFKHSTGLSGFFHGFDWVTGHHKSHFLSPERT